MYIYFNYYFTLFAQTDRCTDRHHCSTYNTCFARMAGMQRI